MYQIIMAHPDDEVIFGWMVLKETDKILICSSDFNNFERQWCKNRKLALQEVCKELKVECECLDYNSEFYRLPTRDETLKRMAEDIQKRIKGKVFTHNPWGEYGHLDHILIHQILAGKKITYSDILIDSNWLPVKKHGLGKKIKKAKWDEELYQKLKAIYVKYNCWTWDKEPIKKANIYENNNGV